ncbi:ABC transporter permease [Micromonospora antibiotica]|uniref:ABC transporter permease subunit n=1 Tax=Micromonospora antibiotica TaxID=2807623 RepID=A0ABS3VHI9_9ACTN|nr:ABC transporter permease subunit [Micromonospora antibiotica]MBO4165103.1 ABC transporter permease subunit [Micromonospora antibiotica]
MGVLRTGLRRGQPLIWGAAGLGLLVAGWAAVAAAGVVPASGLPGPVAVARAFGSLLGDADFVREYLDTLATWAVSLGLAVVVSIPLGLLIGYLAPLARASSLVIDIGRAMPVVTLIPVAIVLIGLGPQMKISVVTFSVFWIVLVNTIYGVRSVEPLTLRVAQALKFGRIETMRRVLLPTTLPYVVTGIRIATGIAFVVTLSAELLGATTGVGTVLVSYQEAQRADAVYAGVLAVSITGMLLNIAAQLAERRVIRWRPSRQE